VIDSTPALGRRILMSITAYPPSMGGAQLLMHSLARQLHARYTVQVVSQWDAHRTDWLLGTTLHAPYPARAYVIDGIPVQRITLPPAARRRLRAWVYAYPVMQGLALRRIAQALAQEMAPWAAASDLIHNCRTGREGLSYASLQLARARDIPFVFTPVHHPRWGTWLHRHFHKLYRQADAVIALTEAERELLIRLGVDARRIHVTGMGPILADGGGDGRRFRDRHHLGDEPLVLFLGQKYPYKGISAVLRAAPLVWERLPQARFAFVGPRTVYSRRLFTAELDARVLELDTVDLQEKTDALAACQVLCVPSLQESFGGVYTEAWSLGKPVIGGDIAALREVIDEGENGYLTGQQPAAIAERLVYLLERPALQTQLGLNGRQKVEARYSWPRLASLTEQVYQQVLG
jgi:glycosyltransferase involved in cell wall biosynthesis